MIDFVLGFFLGAIVFGGPILFILFVFCITATLLLLVDIYDWLFKAVFKAVKEIKLRIMRKWFSTL